MKTLTAGRGGRRRAGFTLLETMLVSGLMAFLVLLASQAWSGFGRPTADVAARCRVAQEARLAVTALAGDLGGGLAGPAARTGTKAQLQWVGRMQPSGSQLWLCFDGGPSPNGLADWGPPDTVIVYEVQGDQLVRWDQGAGTGFTVANHVQALGFQDLGGGKLQIQLTFAYRNITRTYTLIARDP